MQVPLPGAPPRPGDIWGRQGVEEQARNRHERHNQGLINILIAAAAPLAPRPGHTHSLTLTHTHARTHSIWRQRLSRERSTEKEQNRLILIMLKITVSVFPSVWGASDHFFNAPSQLWSSGLVPRGWRGFRRPAFRPSSRPPGRSWGLGGAPGWRELQSSLCRGDGSSSPAASRRIPEPGHPSRLADG